MLDLILTSFQIPFGNYWVISKYIVKTLEKLLKKNLILIVLHQQVKVNAVINNAKYKI